MHVLRYIDMLHLNNFLNYLCLLLRIFLCPFLVLMASKGVWTHLSPWRRLRLLDVHSPKQSPLQLYLKLSIFWWFFVGC